MRVYHARSETLQEKVTKTFRFVPVTNWFYPSGAWCNQHNTDFCPEAGHEGICIRWSIIWSSFFKSIGEYRLKTPIDIKSTMPGTGHTLTFAKIKAMINIDPYPWTWIFDNLRGFIIYADGNEVFKAENEKINQGLNTWYENNFPMKIDISYNRTLDVKLWSVLSCLTGSFRTHLAEPSITIEYIPETPPQPATVRIYVYNRQTGQPVSGALVQLLSGNKVVAQGYTGGDGWVAFQNVPAGIEGVSYMLRVTKGGFETYEEAVDVKPGENSFNVPLVPIPTPPLPEWVKYFIIGSVVVVGGGVAIAALRRPKRPEKPEIIVVK
ncbi:MAG: carboxypeptidase-like regulatory domain-containing protein [Candidatus Bathyarchaeia archaeon]